MPAEDIIQRATSEAGWIAGAFAFLVLAGFGLLGWLIRQLWLWLKELQNFSQTTLLQALRDSNQCMRRNSTLLVDLITILKTKPCLLQSEESISKLSEAFRKISDTKGVSDEYRDE